jgi:hypothetical protein
VLSEARQYGQTKGKNAAQGKYFCCLLRLTGCLLCQPTHTLLLPVLFDALGYLPEVAVIDEAYDIPAVPHRVKKPEGETPSIPPKPVPPVEPGEFVPSGEEYDDDEYAEEIQKEREIHEIAVEAYSQQKDLHDAKTSHEWFQYEKKVTCSGCK